MTKEQLGEGVSVSKRIEEVTALVDGIGENTSITIMVGTSAPVAINPNNSDVEKNVYETISETIKSFKTALEETFEKI